jgi:hypothetical protein
MARTSAGTRAGAARMSACATLQGPTGWRVIPTLWKRQGLKPIFSRSFAAWLKPCPDTRLPTWATWLKPKTVHSERLLLRGAGSQPNAVYFSQNRAICIVCGAGWYPARRLSTGAFGRFTCDSWRVNNPPQVSNLPHPFPPDSRFREKWVALGSQPADSTLVSSLALGPPPSVEKSLDAAA